MSKTLDDVVFRDAVKSNTGAVVIMAGSDSDKPHIDKIVTELGKWGLPYEVRICSAHKQPAELMAAISGYNSLEGSLAYIAVAGGTDALSGTLSFHALGPVVTCPPDTRLADKAKYDTPLNESGLMNPPGSSNAYVGRSANAVRFIAQIFADRNPDIRLKLETANTEKIDALRDADTRFRKVYLGGK